MSCQRNGEERTWQSTRPTRLHFATRAAPAALRGGAVFARHSRDPGDLRLAKGRSVTVSLTHRHHLDFYSVGGAGEPYRIPASLVHQIVVKQRSKRDRCHFSRKVRLPATIVTCAGTDLFFNGGATVDDAGSDAAITDCPPDITAIDPGHVPTTQPSGESDDFSNSDGSGASGGDFGGTDMDSGGTDVGGDDPTD